MQRILIIGSGGAGKSTLARHIGAHLGIEVTHLDAHYWKPGWRPLSADAWEQKVQSLVARERWVLDGNYNGTMNVRLAAADTVIFVDLPRWLCLWRVIKRRIAFHGRSRPDISEGCKVRLTWSFLWWIWTYPQVQRKKILQMLEEQAGHKRVIHLKGRHETELFLFALQLSNLRPTKTFAGLAEAS